LKEGRQEGRLYVLMPMAGNLPMKSALNALD
jgi:hypothetical protein